MFNQDSGLVKIWKDEILKGNKEPKDIPKIKNLKEEVLKALTI